MEELKRTLQTRLARMDVHFEGELLDRAAIIVSRCHTPVEEMTDFMLWAACVSAYSRPEIDVPTWV